MVVVTVEVFQGLGLRTMEKEKSRRLKRIHKLGTLDKRGERSRIKDKYGEEIEGQIAVEGNVYK